MVVIGEPSLILSINEMKKKNVCSISCTVVHGLGWLEMKLDIMLIQSIGNPAFFLFVIKLKIELKFLAKGL